MRDRRVPPRRRTAAGPVEGIWDATASVKANEQAIVETVDSLPCLQAD